MLTWGKIIILAYIQKQDRIENR